MLQKKFGSNVTFRYSQINVLVSNFVRWVINATQKLSFFKFSDFFRCQFFFFIFKQIFPKVLLNVSMLCCRLIVILFLLSRINRIKVNF